MLFMDAAMFNLDQAPKSINTQQSLHLKLSFDRCLSAGDTYDREGDLVKNKRKISACTLPQRQARDTDASISYATRLPRDPWSITTYVKAYAAGLLWRISIS